VSRDQARDRWNSCRRDVERTYQAAQQARERFLRQAGWEHTCELGALWLWKRGTDPCVYLNEAAAIQLALREGFRP
jgi:hypothetical protein